VGLLLNKLETLGLATNTIMILPNFKPALYRDLYEDTDVSRYIPRKQTPQCVIECSRGAGK